MGQVLVGIIIVAVLDFLCLWDVDWDIFRNNLVGQYGELRGSTTRPGSIGVKEGYGTMEIEVELMRGFLGRLMELMAETFRMNQ
ncbi:hypothetical protein FCV25MIE_01067 [Fagus crenata]